MTGDQRFHAVIASGGTGGHFYPSLAIAQEIQQGGNQVTMLLAGRHVTDQIRVAVEHDILAMPTPACPMPSLRRPAAIPPFLIRFSGSILQARRWAKREHPDVVLGMGSFASAPTCLGLRSVGVPLVLHEGNSWMGKANRWLSRFARVAALSLPLSPECPCHCPRAQTGMPLRQSLLQAAARPEPEDRPRLRRQPGGRGH
jgi:UDP-N-acetylglucosamine--N-acetylmuramyl-(pentapeptide) pyrophosphoryl-undecaprenol N-acetylglucosamine transferase